MSASTFNESMDLFLEKNGLSSDYLESASRYFESVAGGLASAAKENPGKPLLVALSGCQGSGKSTLAEYLSRSISAKGLSVLQFSLDDFYLAKSEREARAKLIHPLFRTRGVPGTHDIALLNETLNAISAGCLPVSIPTFNKAEDDRNPPTNWLLVDKPVDVVILEGWCVGAQSVPDNDLATPYNDLERLEDAKGVWRTAINQALRDSYEHLWAKFDHLLFLKAPSFERVYFWRLEQEQKMQRKLDDKTSGRGMSPKEIMRFVQHYQRITDWLLDNLAIAADVIWELGDDRQVKKVRLNGSLAAREVLGQ